MIPFLQQVAHEYLRRGNISDKCFIFPNRRSMVFFMKYLSEGIAANVAGNERTVPVFAPETYTMNDFLFKLYDVPPTDRITLLITLYDCYKSLYPKAETLDEFVFWGDILLGDFNDVDKYRVDARGLFTNVSDFKEIDIPLELTDTQRVAIEQFLKHFYSKSRRLTVDLKSDNPDVKGRFLKIWNILYPLYENFKTELTSKGLAYEGMVYRSVAESLASDDVEAVMRRVFPHSAKFVFVGLNALNECEKTVLRRLRDTSLAEFCWDYSGALIQHRSNRSSFFMDSNVKEFPQSFVVDPEGVSVPEINVVSVPSSIGQVKQLPAILRGIADRNCGGDLSEVGILSEKARLKAADCAVVLPDEGLLMPVLNTIPTEISKINVTMGYPMTSSAFYSFMQMVSALQMNMRKKSGKWYFYHKYLWPLIVHPIFRTACGEEVSTGLDEVRRSGRLYVGAEELAVSEYTSMVFKPVVEDKSKADKDSTDRFAVYLKEVAERSACAIITDEKMILEADFAKEYSDAVSRLRKAHLGIMPSTFTHLLDRLLASVSVPFKGEPLEGLQIMGPLETRALDFNNLILMSVNEGVFPKKNVSSSFIPPELRKGFSLPTYEYQDAVWAYYFYRMITRAKEVWLLYDSRTEGIKSGEESRYIKQLQYHFNIPLRRYVVSPVLSTSSVGGGVQKTMEHVGKIRKMTFSASSLQTYLACPLQFYYKYILRLTKEDEINENVDNGLFGSIYHAVMQALYLGEEAMRSDLDFDDRQAVATLENVLPEVSKDYISGWLKRRDEIKAKVNQMICSKLNAMEVSGRNLVVSEVIVQYVMQTLKRDFELLESAGVDRFVIHGLEQEFRINFKGFAIKGYIDRLDSLSNGDIRVVDYKTGKVLPEDEDINEANAEKIADAIFAKDNAKRPKIALQLYIYDKYLKSVPEYSTQRHLNCIYSTSRLFVLPPESFEVSENFHKAVDGHLEELFKEMTDTDVPFRMASDDNPCTYCDFKNICGK